MNKYLCLQLIKSSYIVFLGIIYTTFGIILSLTYNNLIEFLIPSHNDIIKIFEKDPQKVMDSPKLITRLLISTFIDVSFIVFNAYLIRKIVKRLPFSFEGVCDFQRLLVKEINGGIILAASVITYYTFVAKLKIYRSIWNYDKKKVMIPLIILLIITIVIGNITNIMSIFYLQR